MSSTETIKWVCGNLSILIYLVNFLPQQNAHNYSSKLTKTSKKTIPKLHTKMQVSET